MGRKEHRVVLEVAGESGAWVILRVPFDVEKEFGSREYIGHIDEARKPETRARRIARTIATLDERD